MFSEWLGEISGLSLFGHRLFRAGSASLIAFAIVFFAMPAFIRYLQKLDATADFDTNGHPSPPICGGILVIIAVVFASLLTCQLNGYSVSILLILFAYSSIGGVDDLFKIRAKRLISQGLAEKKDYQDKADGISSSLRLTLYFAFSLIIAIAAYKFIPGLDGHLTVPFFKHDSLYPYLPNWAFIILMSFVTTASANGANFTDGLDSLVSVPLITTSTFIGAVAYISGNAIFAEYLLLPHLPGVDELLPICGAIVGSLLAYLWYNSPPAEIYLGDGGSIGLGGAVGMMFVLVKAELFLPIVGIIFLSESLSVVGQIGWFKITKRRSPTGTGKRIFLRAPLHHHFQLKWKDRFRSPAEVNSKVIWRFHLVSVLAMIVGSLLFFKVR